MGTKTTFTPGPWTIDNKIGRKSQLGIVADAAPCIIAVMGNAEAWPVEAQANAKLIAAAPDLLTACKALVDCLAGHIQTEARRVHVAPEILCPCATVVLPRARAVITKATE
jgi:hypothetical protein